MLRPRQREACLAMLVETPDTSRSLADPPYRIELQDEVGNVPDAAVVAEEVRNVLALRVRYGGCEQDVDPDLTLRDSELYRLLPSPRRQSGYGTHRKIPSSSRGG